MRMYCKRIDALQTSGGLLYCKYIITFPKRNRSEMEDFMCRYRTDKIDKNSIRRGRTQKRLCAAVLLGTLMLFVFSGCGSAKEQAQQGIEQLRTGEYAQAADSFMEALENRRWYDNVDKTTLLLYRGEALMGAGEFESARKVYEGLLSKEPENAEYALNSGLASLGAEDYVKAEKSFEKAIENGSTEAYVYAGRAAEAQHAYKTAADYYTRALDAQTDAASLYEAICRCRLQTEEYQAAREAAEAGLACADETQQQGLLYAQAIAYEYEGDFAAAREKLAVYLEKYPDDAAAQKEYVFLLTR